MTCKEVTLHCCLPACRCRVSFFHSFVSLLLSSCINCWHYLLISKMKMKKKKQKGKNFFCGFAKSNCWVLNHLHGRVWISQQPKTVGCDFFVASRLIFGWEALNGSVLLLKSILKNVCLDKVIKMGTNIFWYTTKGFCEKNLQYDMLWLILLENLLEIFCTDQ